MSEAYQHLLTSLQENRSAGATELALLTLSRLKDCLFDTGEQTPKQIEMIVEDLSHARASMVPLGNALHRWQQRLDPGADNYRQQYLDGLLNVYRQLAQASEQVAENAAELIKPGMTVMTHSRSSQVMAMFEQLLERHMDFNVIVTISAPGNEGLMVASQLNRMDVPVTVITDAEMGQTMPKVDMNIVGCDNWLSDHHFVNKTGTLLQALAARHFGKPFWVLADSFKNSLQTRQTVSLETLPLDKLNLPGAKGISGNNTYFEVIATRLITGRVEEHGLLPIRE
jgi:translation initiation factor 2B subunit (eIF-2B alpha/beta/delta family)